MKKVLYAAMLLIFFPAVARAHFGMLIPSDDIIAADENKYITLELKFIHPFEGHYMQMQKPKSFGVVAGGKKHDLLPTLRENKVKGFSTWETRYRIKRPGDHVFYLEPAPYWESAEETYIIHYTKVVVSTLGLEEGWDRPVGLPVEILPLTRPYGLWAGNIFQGVVLTGGKPVPHAEVEVEYYNVAGKIKAPAIPYITQVIKADSNGVFTYAMPREGWWGFAALSTAGYKLKHKGKEYPVELGAVIWVRAREMR